MIELNYQNVSVEKIGHDHGLDLPGLFDQYADPLKSIITKIYDTKDQPGGWKKWLNLGYDTALVKEIQEFAASVKGQYDDLVVLGIGGSSLGGYALLRALVHPYWNNLPAEKRNSYPRFHFIENVDADQIHGLLDILTPEKTLFNVISKSGTTAETMSAFMIAKDWLEKKLPKTEVAKRIIATTDKAKGILRPIATEEGYATFEVPDDVGGRFSVFSAVGLLPVALCGVDIDQLLAGVRDLDKQLQNPDLNNNMAAQGALIQVISYRRGKPISVFMPYSYRLASISDWYVQLWAESLGKKLDRDGAVVNVGPTPVRAVGVTDQHSQVQLFNEGPFDKIFTFVTVKQSDRDIQIPKQFDTWEDLSYLVNKPMSQLMAAEFESTRASLTTNRRPNVTITLPTVDAYHVGQLLYLLEVQTAIAGDLMNIDPFDQPGVELAKQYTHALMGRKGFEHLIAEAKGEKTPVGTP